MKSFRSISPKLTKMKKLNSIKLPFVLLAFTFFLLASGCHNTSEGQGPKSDEVVENWTTKLDQKLKLLGHRNWVLVVDKAYPEQNSPGVEYMYVDEQLLPVLKQVLVRINSSSHVKPIIYRDKELSYITEEQAKGIKQFLAESKKIFGNQLVQAIPHNSLFEKLDTEAKLFKVLIIKTKETLPYTSVVMQLDCAYWNADKEKQLRAAMGE